MRRGFIVVMVGILILLLAGATIFYHGVEGWTWVDSFYFSTITVTTVGYGDVAPKTDIGKLFTAFFAIGSIGIFISIATNIINNHVESYVQKRYESMKLYRHFLRKPKISSSRKMKVVIESGHRK